jgi:uncharacterized protein (TIGR02246 family)
LAAAAAPFDDLSQSFVGVWLRFFLHFHAARASSALQFLEIGVAEMKRTNSLLVAAALLAVVLGWLVAQERPAAGQKKVAKPIAPPSPSATATAAEASSSTTAAARPEDEQAILAASQAFTKAFESGDAKALLALFTEEAEYISDNSESLRGRSALAKAYEAFFAKRKQLKAESKTEKIRFLGSDTAIEEGTFTVTAKDGPPDASRFSTLYVRQGGKWLIALLKEWGDETTTKASLQDLSWLIGTWESQGAELAARTTYEWTSNKAFIKAQYTLTPKKAGEQPSSGTQVIGIDPAVGQIRAWLFASDGGIGESTWVWDENRWMIESIGTLVNGSRTTSVNILARTGDDTFTWRSVSRNIAGEPQPDIAAVTVKRVAGATTTSAQAAR